MRIKNILKYTEDRKFIDSEIFISDGRINNDSDDNEVIDGEGCYAIPGLIDIHFHGCNGYDFCDGTDEAIKKIARYEAIHGITGICPATMTLPVFELNAILKNAANYERKDGEAELLGINMEGPFISKIKKGAQNEHYIIPCNIDVANEFLKLSEGLVKFIGLAPEESENYEKFIKEMKDKVHISLAHTNADYETAKKAIDAGADHGVHLYNAMHSFSHREPGCVGAILESDKTKAELICDGLHIHPQVVRSVLKQKGVDNVIFISDSMRATGLKDGTYTLGGLDIQVTGNRATLAGEDTLAGSVTNLMGCMKVAVKDMGIPLETAVACVTMNPAKQLGVYDERGSLTVGKKADIVLLDMELNIKAVIMDGKRIL